jgi:hypothetical protein
MPNWNSVLKEISDLQMQGVAAHDVVRRKYLAQLFEHTGRNVIAYYSGFLSKTRTEGIEINDDDTNGFMLSIHEMDKERGLDLILHTPGGDGAATVAIVDYLRKIFDDNIRAIVPQIAMSAGTMIACSCKTIMMGKHSSLGPIDPQFGTIAAANLMAEVKKAKRDISKNPNLAMFWNPILSRITPSFLERCEWALKDANDFIEVTLRRNMFAGLPVTKQNQVVRSVRRLLANKEGRAHNTHLRAEACAAAGLKIEMLEDDPELQDLVLTIHHCYVQTLTNTPAIKIVENHMGRTLARVLQQQITLVPQMGGPSLGAGGPAQLGGLAGDS